MLRSIQDYAKAFNYIEVQQKQENFGSYIYLANCKKIEHGSSTFNWSYFCFSNEKLIIPSFLTFGVALPVLSFLFL